MGRSAREAREAIGALVAACYKRGDGVRDVLVGLIGRGIQLSRTPGMHMREAARHGLRCSYVLIDFDQLDFDDADLPVVLDAVRVLGFSGVNVTHPLKQAVIAQLDDLAEEAAAIGAVNTVVFGERAIGYNTDCWGFAESFRTGLEGVPTRRVTQFGAGGAGAAVGYALLQLGVAELVLVDSDGARATTLATRLSDHGSARVEASSDVDASVRSADGIVNTTPIGMAKYPGTPFPGSLLASRQWVADIIYFPVETQLLREAGEIGCRVLPGTGMAIGQAVRAFELFTGRSTDMSAMARHFEAAA